MACGGNATVQHWEGLIGEPDWSTSCNQVGADILRVVRVVDVSYNGASYGYTQAWPELGGEERRRHADKQRTRTKEHQCRRIATHPSPCFAATQDALPNE